MLIRSRTARTFAVLALSLSLASCTQAKVARVTSAGPEHSGAMKELSPEERKKLSAVLEGEVQTVYASDTGLARVSGQVANLGQKPFSRVRFEIVATLDAGGDDSESRTIATFDVTDLEPGDIRPFDVQTTAETGGVEQFTTRVRGAE